ncbi:unnamed protein product [Cochlearia groenlandica]
METKITKSMIVGVQSVMPVEVTQHRKFRPISAVDPIGAGIFRRTLNIVTYYKLANGESGEKGWLVAGWIKESLGRALTEQPMVCGRLRWRKTAEKEEEDGLEVVANDSGARLVEAKFPASMSEFLEMVKRDKGRGETETVFWRDIDEVDPQFSPLFYVQVTNFESGGYSIGISCSILIADILLETDFLIKWAQIQSSLANSKTTQKPIFHLPSLKKDLGYNFIELSSSTSLLDRGEPVAIRAKTCPKMSLACMKKAVATREKADVFFFIEEQCNGKNSNECDVMKVEICPGDDAFSDCDCDMEKKEVGVLNARLEFGESCEGITCWVGFVSKGVVFVVPSTFGDGKSFAKFVVALPEE